MDATTIASTGWRSNHGDWTRKSGGSGRGAAAARSRATRHRGSAAALFRRRKVCKFCADKIDDINYKDVKLLAPFVPERGKILPRRISGTCAMHQRKLQTAIKRARQLALLPVQRPNRPRSDREAFPWKSFSENTSTTSGAAARS